MATTRLYTVEDVEKSPPEGEWELIDGELVEVSPSGGPASRYGGRIYARMGFRPIYVHRTYVKKLQT